MLVAHILRPRGNKGEVAAVLLTDFPERLTKLKEVFVGKAEGKPEPYKIGLESCWISQNHKGQGVFHFAGIHSINDAEQFRGMDVLLPFEQRVALPEGQYFASDLIGCAVFESFGVASTVSSSPCLLNEAPALLGTVVDVQFPGDEIRGTPLLEVETANGELLIPLAMDICKRIDIGARRIEVVLPDGLRGLDNSDA